MRVAAAVTVALLLGASPAFAQPSRTPPVQAPYQYQPAPYPYQPAGPTRTHRYGAKIAVADALSFGAMLVGVIMLVSTIDTEDSDDDVTVGAVLMLGGAAGYVLGGPIVHSSEGNKSGAWKSVGLRLGLPLLGGVIGEAMRDESSGDDDAGASLSGIGILTAMVVDWFVLAKVERPVPGYLPYATTNRDGDVTFGLAGSF